MAGSTEDSSWTGLLFVCLFWLAGELAGWLDAAASPGSMEAGSGGAVGNRSCIGGCRRPESREVVEWTSDQGSWTAGDETGSTRGKGNERKLAKVGSRKDAALNRTLTAGGSVLQAGRLATTLSQARLARDPSSHVFLAAGGKVTRRPHGIDCRLSM